MMETWEYKSEAVHRDELDTRLAQMQADERELAAFAPKKMAGSTAFGVGDLNAFRYRVVFRR